MPVNFPPYHENWPSSGHAIPKFHRQVTVHCPVNDTLVTADEGIIADLRTLWHHGILTEWSCEGGLIPASRYVSLKNPGNTDAAVELLPWAFANEQDRRNGAVYSRPGGALRGTFPAGLAEVSGDLH